MKSVLFFSGIFLSSSIVFASTASLVTVAPGRDLLSAFGHSAIAIDHEDGSPMAVYEYVPMGVKTLAAKVGKSAKSDDSNAGINDFLAGKTLARVQKQELPVFSDLYGNQKGPDGQVESTRDVTLEKLSLTAEQITALETALNADFEKGFYPYSVFTSNCATRPRDLIFSVLDKKERAKLEKQKSKKTFTQIASDEVDETVKTNNAPVELPLKEYARSPEALEKFKKLLANFKILYEMKSGADLVANVKAVDTMFGKTNPALHDYLGKTEMTRPLNEYETIATPRALRSALAKLKVL